MDDKHFGMGAAVLTAFLVPAGASAGFGVDVGFGMGGRVTLPPAIVAEAVVAQPDDKLVVVGSDSLEFRAVRYDADGTLDGGFGVGGVVSVDVGGTGPQTKAVALQADGKIVLGGYATFGGGGRDAVLVRLNTDGTVDTGFGTAGIVQTGDVSDERVFSVVVQPDDKIVAAGAARDAGPGFDYLWLARFDPTGALDPTFGTGGIVETSAGNGVGQLLLQPDGKLVVGASEAVPLNDLLLVRYLPDGALDPGFGAGGIVALNLPGVTAWARAAALQSDGRIVVTGVFDLFTKPDVFLARLDTDGSLDPTFGGTGFVRTVVGGNGSAGAAVVIEPDGTIDVAGATWPFGTLTGRPIMLGRWEADGDVDTTFAPCVQVVTPTVGVSDSAVGAVDMARQSDGDLIVLTAKALASHTSLVDPVCASAAQLKVTLKYAPMGFASANLAKVVWKSAGLDPAGFGDPTVATDVQLCVMDESGAVPRLRIVTQALGGEMCGTKPCWKATRTGFKYRAKSAHQLPGGKFSVKLTGTPSTGKIGFKGKNGLVPLDESLPLALPATIRLQRTDLGACWDGVFSSAIRNDDGQFRAKLP